MLRFRDTSTLVPLSPALQKPWANVRPYYHTTLLVGQPAGSSRKGARNMRQAVGMGMYGRRVNLSHPTAVSSRSPWGAPACANVQTVKMSKGEKTSNAKKRPRLLPGLAVRDGFMRHPFDLEFGVRTSGQIGRASCR